MAERKKENDVITIGKTHLSKNFFESLRGKTAQEIKAERPGMHDLIIEEIIKQHEATKPKKKVTPKPKKKDSEEK